MYQDEPNYRPWNPTRGLHLRNKEDYNLAMFRDGR